MTSVSQIVPNFIQGINEQPDELKKPGQVRDAVNCIPDVTEGLVKRPGYELLTKMDCDGSGSWFEMYREDENGLDFRYVINTDKRGYTRAWNCDTRKEVPVKGYEGGLKIGEFDRERVKDTQGTLEYMQNSTGESPSKLRQVVINDSAFIVNPDRVVSMSKSDETVRPYEAFIELTTFDPNRSYNFQVDMIGSADTEYSKAVRVELLSKAGFSGDNNRQEGCPLVDRWRGSTVTRLGGKSGNVLVPDAAAPVEVEIEIGARPKVGGEWDDNAYCNYYVVNTVLLDGGLGWKVGNKFKLQFPKNAQGNDNPEDFEFTFEVTETVNVDPTIDFQITAGDVTDAGSILTVLGVLKNEFEARSEFNTVEIVGNGIYLKSDQPFLVDTSEKDLANIMCTQTDPDLDVPNPIMVVNNTANLPLECKVGVVVKVENSFSEDDDYYVRFWNDYNSTETTSGQGYWNEVPKPLEKDKLNSNTMPHILFHDQPTSDIDSEYFVITRVAYDRRGCGDESFNPSFADKKITNLAFFRNRLIAFSEENIISTVAGDYDNWFPATALTVSPSDPIDIAATTNYSSILYGGIVINNAMVVFSEYNQYLLTTDSDVFDSRTAKVTQIGAYHYDTKSDPMLLGTNVAFMGGAGNDSKMYEMYNIFREGQVDVVERSKLIAKSFKPGYNIVSSSRENGTVTAGKYGSNVLWMYKYFKQGNQNDVQTAWTRMVLPDPLVFHFDSKETHFVVVRNSGASFLMKAEKNSEVYLDAWTEEGVDLGYGHTDLTTVDGKSGKQFEMRIKLPTFYVLKPEQQAFRADTTSSLTIHRIKLNTGPTNAYDVRIRRYGKDPYVIMYEQTMQDAYKADDDPTREDTEQTIPLYERNTNLEININSSYPAPTTLYSLRWEGDFNPRYYKRV